jgi:hypothetical protein
MRTEDRIRNTLIRKIQHLSTEKLGEINNFLEGFGEQLKSKEKTLSLAGSWKDLDVDVFVELTENLHVNRAADRQIN